MQRTIRVVVFDMDGLMLDTEPIYKVAWQAASTELGYDLDDAFYATFVAPKPRRAASRRSRAARAPRVSRDTGRRVAVEDSEAGILAASRAGLVALLVPDGAPASDVAIGAASHVMSSLTEAERLIRGLLQRGGS